MFSQNNQKVFFKFMALSGKLSGKVSYSIQKFYLYVLRIWFQDFFGKNYLAQMEKVVHQN